MAYYEPGLHLARVTSQGWEDSKTGKPMIVFQCQILSRITYDQEGNELLDDLNPSDYDQTIRVVVDNNNPESMDYSMKKLRYAGFTGESFIDMNLEGQQVRVKNTPHDYNGKNYDGFDLALPPLDKKPVNVLDASAARKFDALFGKRLKDGTTPKPNSPAAETVPRDAPPDDDCPF